MRTQCDPWSWATGIRGPPGKNQVAFLSFSHQNTDTTDVSSLRQGEISHDQMRFF
ncbi:hypothetical protein ccbrp13_60240 [Ktedonobacteria bacterium brp13]|nr:hypothetical protein ccbrp13_60240 [Ktedonobacteria bacterium brp13]